MIPLTKIEHHKAEETTNKTFRLEFPATHLLEQEMEDRNLSANAIVNELILKDLRRDRGLRASKPVCAASLIIRLLAEEISEEKVIEIGEKLRMMPY